MKARRNSQCDGGERILLCKITWGHEDARHTEFVSTDPNFPDAEKESIHEFLSNVARGTPHSDVQARAEAHQPLLVRYLHSNKCGRDETFTALLLGWITSSTSPTGTRERANRSRCSRRETSNPAKLK